MLFVIKLVYGSERIMKKLFVIKTKVIRYIFIHKVQYNYLTKQFLNTTESFLKTKEFTDKGI